MEKYVELGRGVEDENEGDGQLIGRGQANVADESEWSESESNN